MQAKTRHKAILASTLGIIAVLLAASATIAISTMSFPLPAIDHALFRDVSFDYQGGTDATGAASSEQRYWSWDTQLDYPEITRAGYTLSSWDENDDATQACARWELTVYPLSFDLCYGELASDAQAALPTSSTIKSAAFTLPTPTRYAYTFDGWSIGDSQQRIDRIDPATIYDATTIRAHWLPREQFQPRTLYLGLDYEAVPYEYCIDSDTAPSDCAGVWKGTANVDDGKSTYYIGHNPGVFAQVEQFDIGSRFAVCDDKGALGVYQVENKVVILYEGTLWTKGLAAMTMPDAEYASLQTCRGDKTFMDIYVSKRID